MAASVPQTERSVASNASPPASLNSMGSVNNSIKMPITGISLKEYPVSVRSLGTGIGDDLDYDAYSVIDRSRPSSPVHMPVVGGDPLSATSTSSGFKSKMGNLFRKRNSPRNSARNSVSENYDMNAASIPTSMSSSADANSYMSATGEVPYASSGRSVYGSQAPSQRSTRSRGMNASIMVAAGPEAMAKERFFVLLRSFIDAFRAGARMSFILRPIDAIADSLPSLEPTVVIIEMIMFMWLLYEVSILLEIITAATKTVCRPAIVLGRMIGFGFK